MKMSRSLSLITKSLAGKLILAISLLIIIGGGISWYALINAGKKNLLNNAVKYTASYSDLIKKSTRYSMSVFHRGSIQQTIDSLGSAEDIRRIRIFDDKGKIFYSSKHEEIGRTVDRNATACKGCHDAHGTPSVTLKTSNQWVIYQGGTGSRVLTFIDPIYNEPTCYTAACHVHFESQRVLGILETDFSLASADWSIEKQTIDTTIYAVIFMSISSIVLYIILAKFVLNPVSTISNAMKKVAEGDLAQTITMASSDEMGLLSQTFNLMTQDLKTAREKMENWTQSLESEVEKKTSELKKSRDKLVQAEKLAALGRLTSDVAHEIRNPLTAIGGFARRLFKIVNGTREKEYTDVIVTEVDKLEKILRNVLTFSRNSRFHLERADIADVVNDVLKLYRELCAEQSIIVEVETGEGLPAVLIDKDQVGQALSNLITNAIDAMPSGGTLKIKAGREDLHAVTFIYLKVYDTGQGIPSDKLQQIFEPFFTTKDIGHGTGLGLSISRKIVEEHGGFISAESVPGKGSAFGLYFAYQGEEESGKTPCWEYMKCGRDNDATSKCPAYPNFGRTCWVVAGTFCEGMAQGTFAQKYEDCLKCKFYREVISKKI